MHEVRELDAQEQVLLAGALPETVETMTGIHRLRRGITRTYVARTSLDPGVAVVQSRFLMEEPALYGDEPALAWTVLKRVPCWTAVNASSAVAAELAALIEAETGTPCALIEEIYYTLPQPVAVFTHPRVRQMSMDDLEMVEAATEPLAMQGWRYGNAEALLAAGVLAGAVVDGELVSVAFTAAETERFGEVGIKTREDFRGRGFSTAAASLVCAELQAAGKFVIWSTDQDNVASHRVAAKLGFSEVSRRVYVNR
jgi:RimJ/RimL family protein N-acetyltransferase